MSYISIKSLYEKPTNIVDTLARVNHFKFEWNAERHNELEKHLNTSSGQSSNKNINLTDEQLLSVAFTVFMNTIDEKNHGLAKKFSLYDTYEVNPIGRKHIDGLYIDCFFLYSLIDLTLSTVMKLGVRSEFPTFLQTQFNEILSPTKSLVCVICTSLVKTVSFSGTRN